MYDGLIVSGTVRDDLLRGEGVVVWGVQWFSSPLPFLRYATFL